MKIIHIAVLPHGVLNECVYCLPLNILFLSMAITSWQSQRINTEGIDFIPNEILAKKFYNHSTLELVNSRAINYDSVVVLLIMVCLADFKVTAPPPRVNT